MEVTRTFTHGFDMTTKEQSSTVSPTEFSVFSTSPWLIEGAPECLLPLFANAPSVTLEINEEIYFGLQDWVYLIDEGLIGSYAVHPDMSNLMMGLFGRGSLLGAFKALLHGSSSSLSLLMKVHLPVRMRRISTSALVDFLHRDDRIAAETLWFLLRQHEQQMEGMLLQDLIPVEVRLARIVDTLYRAADAKLKTTLTPIPVPVTVQQLSEMVHADRAFVSRLLSKWHDAGCFVRTGRRLSFSSAILEH